MTDTQACRAFRDAYRSGDRLFAEAAYTEAFVRRGMTPEGCLVLFRDEETRAAEGWGILLGIGLSAAAARKSQLQYGGDLSWAWDQFYNDNMQLVWACRGEQTGKFADDWRCAGRAQVDSRWPGFLLTTR